MYDDLRKALANCHQLVGWYALGEAIRLTESIARVVNRHRANPNNDNAKQSLLETAKQTSNFLGRLGNNQSPEILNELNRVLIEIKMEE